jgi:hypothetical protein
MLAVAACRNFDAPITTLAVNPPSLQFTAAQSGLGPPLQSLIVDRRGTRRLAWRARADVPWLRIAQVQDTAPAVAWVTAIVQGLSLASHSGHVVVTAGGDSAVVPVTFVVTATVSMTGRWALAADSLSMGMLLVDSGGVVTGSGDFNVANTPRRFFRVRGTAQPPAVSLTLTQTDSTRSTIVGSLIHDNALDAVLDGGGFTRKRVIVFRQ